jgi:hypothetical protein
VVLDRRREVQLAEDGGDVLLHRTLRHDELLGDRGVRPALGHQAQHLALARRQTLERILAATPAEQQRDDLGVERGPAARHAADGVGERVDVRDAVLQQVARALRRLGQEVERVRLLHVLRQDEHAGLRMLGADAVGRA